MEVKVVNKSQSQAESLREQLRRDFPTEAGYEVEEATRIELVDGRETLIPLTIVRGNGVDLTFFDSRPTNIPGAKK